MIDTQGRVATSSFTIFRSSLPLVVKWALTNNPLANAYAYAHSSKWHILTGTWRQLPVPRIDAEASRRIETAANTYLASVHAFENDFSLRNDEDRDAEREALRVLHWRMDAEVLKLYALPVELERRLLDYFAGCKRVGVPFHQDRYFPPHFHEALSLADFLAITADWEATNTRRLELIEFKLQGQLGAEGRTELERLKKLAWAKAQLVRPLPLEEAKATESELKRKGLWVGP
jgi:hypothetical protein